MSEWYWNNFVEYCADKGYKKEKLMPHTEKVRDIMTALTPDLMSRDGAQKAFETLVETTEKVQEYTASVFFGEGNDKISLQSLMESHGKETAAHMIDFLSALFGRYKE